ncbi:hypothetical protein NE664_08820 [Anaerotignum faecicola]|nr:hypothetical protein [Anaerotignum faecicola]
MAKLTYKMIPEGMLKGKYIPLNIAFIDYREVKACGVTPKEAFEAVAKTVDGPIGMNIFDPDVVTTTSDGVMVDGTTVFMAAADRGKMNKDFGYLEMAEMPYSEQLIKEEPHLIQWDANFKGKRLFRGPDPATKIIPVHNVCISGRASNNNSATEMMNIVTMEEILLPILGQQQIIENGKVVLGMTGGVMSVGIGMIMPEKYGRVFPTRQFPAGETAHGSGIYAQTLKAHIPCIVADKSVLAKYIIKALQAGCIPGRTVGASPAVLGVARAMGISPDYDNITERAYEELASIGCTKEWMTEKVDILTPEEIIARADEIIPGIDDATKYDVSDLVQVVTVEI